MAAELFIFLIFLFILATGIVISLFVPDRWFEWVQHKVFRLEDNE